MAYWYYNVITDSIDMDSDLDCLLARAAAADFYGYIYQGSLYSRNNRHGLDLSTIKSSPVAYLF